MMGQDLCCNMCSNLLIEEHEDRIECRILAVFIIPCANFRGEYVPFLLELLSRIQDLLCSPFDCVDLLAERHETQHRQPVGRTLIGRYECVGCTRSTFYVGCLVCLW